ncbi:unnamed protein product [Arabidopsis halleri]
MTRTEKNMDVNDSGRADPFTATTLNDERGLVTTMVS